MAIENQSLLGTGTEDKKQYLAGRELSKRNETLNNILPMSNLSSKIKG